MYVPSSLLECRELSPVSEFESVSPRGSDMDLRLEDDLAMPELPPEEPEASEDVRFSRPPTVFGLKRERGMGRSGNSGVDKIRSRSLNRTLFSLPQPPLPEELPDDEALPGLPIFVQHQYNRVAAWPTGGVLLDPRSSS